MSILRLPKVLSPHVLCCGIAWSSFAEASSGCVPHSAAKSAVPLPAPPIAVSVESPIAVNLVEADSASERPGEAPPSPVVLCRAPCARDVDWRPTKTWWVESGTQEPPPGSPKSSPDDGLLYQLDRTPVDLAPGRDTKVIVRVDPGIPGLDLAAAGIMLGSGISGLVGALLISIEADRSPGPFRADAPLAIASFVFDGVFLVGFAVGIPIILTSGRSVRVEQVSHPKAHARAPRYWLGEF